MSRRVRALLLVGLVLILIGAGLVWHGVRQRVSLPSFNDEPRALPAFRLQTATGEFTEQHLRGHWSLLFFGYLSCPDVCPTTLTAVRNATVALSTARLTAPQVVFVSVDAARDTPPLLQAYLAAFDAAYIGATGSDAALAPLVTALNAYYQRDDAHGGQYSVDHSAALYLIDPQGRLSKIFLPPFDGAALARDIVPLIRTP